MPRNLSAFIFATLALSFAKPGPVLAQTPAAVANTLVNPVPEVSTAVVPGNSDTTVTPDQNRLDIAGGQASGGPDPSLIHQFQQFDLGETDIANFIVGPDIDNVVALIRSLSASQIDGLLTLTSSNPDLDATANLILVNPAGIVFGENATLQLPGDLTATTASGLLFDDALLSLDGSVALTDGTAADISDLGGDVTGYWLLSSASMNQGRIENRGSLAVSAGQAITLVGEYVQNDGSLNAPEGEINLVAVPGDNLVRLSRPGGILSLELTSVANLTQAGDGGVATLTSDGIASALTGGEGQGATQMQQTDDGAPELVGSTISYTDPGTVLVRGDVNASSSSSSTSGSVNILGEQIAVVGSTVSADGVDRGGTLSIGGSPSGFSASSVYVDRSSTLSADGLSGSGGIISIWALDLVQFYGVATADGVSPLEDGPITIESGNILDIRQPAGAAGSSSN